MVDPDRLGRILRRIGNDVAKLRRYADEPRAGLLEVPERLDAIKYVFVTAIEGCIDAAQHVCASESWRAPSANAEAMDVLSDHDVIDRQVAESMRRAVGFRNVLVHGSRDVIDEEAIANLDRLGDIERFIDALGTLLD